MTIKKIIDITKTISGDMVIYPNDPAVKIEEIKKHNVTLTKISIGSHTGTHLDMPKHMLKNGKSLDFLNLNNVIGECVVLDFTNINKKISIEDIKNKIKNKKINFENIVLIKTKNSFDKKFNKNSVYLTEDAVKYIIYKKIKTIGVDSLSIDKFNSNCTNHHLLLKKNIVIFENLDLSKVEEGRYFFIGLPLKIKNSDGAPARAVLLCLV